MIKSLFSAFLMYSRIPMPETEWNENNRKYVLCFFPLIGAVIGGVFLLWFFICDRFLIGNMLFSAVGVGIPVWITGGIHLDGFCDVHDAKACMGSRERCLEVMKDSRVGAFAVIHLCLYFLLQFGIFTQIHSYRILGICALGFVLSRAESGFCATVFRYAVTKSSVENFKNAESKKIIVITEIIYILTVCATMIFLEQISGLSAVLGSILYVMYYRNFAYKKFGGVTGDLAGYFLQNCELIICLCAVVSHFVTLNIVETLALLP